MLTANAGLSEGEFGRGVDSPFDPPSLLRRVLARRDLHFLRTPFSLVRYTTTLSPCPPTFLPSVRIPQRTDKARRVLDLPMAHEDLAGAFPPEPPLIFSRARARAFSHPSPIFTSPSFFPPHTRTIPFPPFHFAPLPAAPARLRLLPRFNRLVRVTLTDGRVIVGRLQCIDRSRNLVLQGAEAWASPEVLRAETPEETARRFIGPVMVPGSALVRCEAAQP